ncbi:hypothetical protein BDY24DRAFT_11944 [Mrakia frigida]|uniref:uncharacterized protein n=1 Tax=Mrakia frigida TaxID=29902 RepID=UPI003FCC22C5
MIPGQAGAWQYELAGSPWRCSPKEELASVRLSIALVQTLGRFGWNLGAGVNAGRKKVRPSLLAVLEVKLTSPALRLKINRKTTTRSSSPLLSPVLLLLPRSLPSPSPSPSPDPTSSPSSILLRILHQPSSLPFERPLSKRRGFRRRAGLRERRGTLEVVVAEEEPTGSS